MRERRQRPSREPGVERVRRVLRSVLNASRRRHVADVRFYQLLSDADRERGRADRGTGARARLDAASQRP